MTEETQDEPVLDQHETTEAERREGLVAQMRADLSAESPAVIEQALRHRLADIGMTLDDAEIARLAAEICGTAPAD